MKEQYSPDTNWWLLLGVASFVGMFIYSVASGGVAGDAIIVDSIEWLAGCVPYFFMGALVGWICDVLVARHRKRTLRFPYWVALTIGFIVVSIGAALIFAPSKPLFVRLIFPVAYGVFFAIFASEALFQTTGAAAANRVWVEFGLLVAFAAWLYTALRTPPRRVMLRRILITAIMLFLTVGAVSCAQQLA